MALIQGQHPTAERVAPEHVHEHLKRTMLVDGFDIVLDMQNSRDCFLRDARTGEDYLDFFTFFASNPLGMNHPKLHEEPFKARLLDAALHKPSNSDMYTTYMADFVNTFSRIAKPDHFKYLFFVEGGSVAVENGLKAAFDWKVQKNFAKGYIEEKGHKVIHFKEAFHGRTGYSLSLTNTDPSKIKYFPKFDWPRVSNPKIIFPLEQNLEAVIEAENKSIAEIHKAIAENPDDIALIILEPIQCEGGDNFFRPEFLLKLRQIADENDILLMFDEVQTGLGITGKMWTSEYYVMPDIISFGKKVQACGIMASERLDEVPTNCFRTSSRINSTWGGNLADMVRSTRMLEIMHEDNILENVRYNGGYLLDSLRALETEFPQLVSQARGLGLLCSFNLPNPEIRDAFKDALYQDKMILLGCGKSTVRFRTPLNVTREHIDMGLKKIRNALHSLSK
ncbi:MAG: L-lysine 6-transaminase [Ignavibacteria bacterium]|nr:L-lysine 6-transaminase [Ignavibacteria bacterium]